MTLDPLLASAAFGIGIVVGLVAGKTIGISLATWLVSRFTRAQLDESLGWPDVIGLAMLAGIGFTVSLLIGALAYGEGSVRDEHVKVGVLVGTLTAALLASVLLRLRDRRYRRIAADASPTNRAENRISVTRKARVIALASIR